MTLDTVFDMASLTKVVATTTAVMQLVERGVVRLTDPVATWVPGFERYGKGSITIRHLLTHVSGLRPDVDLGDPWKGYDAAIELANDEVPQSAPGERFVYSDINFFLLGDIVARASGLPLERYVAERVFAPLGMTDTGFLPPIERVGRIAPTERCRFLDAWPCKAPEVEPLRGVVHDPTARRMGGVAGHAGLFSTARDLTRFARMLLGGGALGPRRVLSPLTVAKMIAPATPAGMPPARGLGWDVDTSFSANRGELLPVGSFGHTGFTGTSLWVDPRTKLFVIFLSSRLHPDGMGDVGAVRARIATIAASAITTPTLDTLAGTAHDRHRLRRRRRARPRRAGHADHPRAARHRRARARRLRGAPGQEGRPRHQSHRARDVGRVHHRRAAHGAGRHAGGALQPRTRHPRAAGRGGHRVVERRAHRAHDPLALRRHAAADRRDARRASTRWSSTCRTSACASTPISRPWATCSRKPRSRRSRWSCSTGRIRSTAGTSKGRSPTDTLLSFIAYMPMPIRHGMTIGELAQLFNAERKIGADLTVVKMDGWRRDQWFDQTGLTWVNPSPNMRNLNQATLYPGIGAIEYANISVGRGTDQPFEQIGAPWIDGPRLAAALNARGLAGIRFYPVRFTPASSVHEGQACQGVFMVVTNREQLQPTRVGMEIASALYKLHGDQFDVKTSERLVGTPTALARAKAGDDPAAIVASWADAEATWRRLRAKYLLYR